MFSSEIKSVHFTGIGGTAMASAAAAMLDKGFTVTGSDQNVYEPMASFLAAKKIPVMNGYDERNLASKPDLVVIGNAISRGNPEAEYVLDHKLRYCSLAALLAEFFIRGKRSIVVAGTHGKTTTTSLLTWVFEHNGLNPSYLIGGIPNNFSQGARFTDSEWFIIEGDEYDTAFFDKRSKFIHYQPEIAIVNNLEFDHADIFENLDAMKKTFSHFIRLVPRNGLLLGNGDDENLKQLLNVTHCPVKRFGLGENNSVRAFNLNFGPTATTFEIPSFKFHLNLVGELNVRNALAVIAAAKHCGLSNKQIQSAFDTFKGIKRRLEVKGIAGGVTVIDDFGHHPTAIRETLKALRLRYAKEKIWAVFEPRSNTTRRNVFQDELAASFADANAVVVSEVARLEQIPADERLNPENSWPTSRLPVRLPRICRTPTPSSRTLRTTRRAAMWFASSATAASTVFMENCSRAGQKVTKKFGTRVATLYSWLKIPNGGKLLRGGANRRDKFTDGDDSIGRTARSSARQKIPTVRRRLPVTILPATEQPVIIRHVLQNLGSVVSETQPSQSPRV